MLKTLVILAGASLLSFTAFAADETAHIESRTTLTGLTTPIYTGVTECSKPSMHPESGSDLSIESKFSYIACEQSETAQYVVTGKFWNENYDKFKGTSTFSYQLNNVSLGDSEYMETEKAVNGKLKPFDFSKYVTLVNRAVTKCEATRSLILSSQKLLTSTPCNGMTPRF